MHAPLTRFVLLILLILPGTAFADNASRLNREGIDLFRERKFEESAQQFTEALVERPGSPELVFNRGTALSASGNPQEAVKQLEQAAGAFQDSSRSAAALFNAGNTLTQLGNTEAAIEQYKQAVKLDQHAGDIRKNLELTLRKQQQSPPPGSGDGEQQQEQQENKDPQQPPQEKEQPEQQEQPQNQDDEVKSSPMSPDDAQRILDAMLDEEEKAFELRRKMLQDELKPSDDW